MRFGSMIFCAPLAAFAAATVAFSSAAFAAPPSPQTGKAVYMDSGCFACHGELGYGGAGPRFRHDKLLAIDKYVAGQILIGRGIMPAFADKLSDQQIAAVATYVRNSWGNKFGAVSAQEVAQARKSLKAPDKASQTNQ
jgi:mono/diheme cytochrome c family protein